MEDLYTIIGRKQVDYDNLRDQYRILLVQVGRMHDGTLDPKHMTIDTEALTWRIDQPAAPAAQQE